MESLRTLNCPDCGHELSTYQPPQASQGEMAATTLTSFVASWRFPTFILLSVVVWAVINIAVEPFEPSPVVALAWVSATLATVAACQGPLILLAQRRAAMNDRARDEEAFKVSLNNEQDLHQVQAMLRTLSDKIDSLAEARS